jgi:hypothetical protein
MEIIDRIEVDVHPLHKFLNWTVHNGALTWKEAFIIGGFSSIQVQFFGEYDRKYSLSAKDYTLFSLKWIE